MNICKICGGKVFSWEKHCFSCNKSETPISAASLLSRKPSFSREVMSYAKEQLVAYLAQNPWPGQDHIIRVINNTGMIFYAERYDSIEERYVDLVNLDENLNVMNDGASTNIFTQVVDLDL